MAKEPEMIFREYCATHGMRYTRERQMIIKEICRKEGHFDVDGLFARIRGANPGSKLAKVSIYRNIPHLLGAGIIRISLSRQGHLCYEQALGRKHHDHMLCVKCGRVFEFYDPVIDKRQAAICREHDFDMQWHTHVIFGLCADCRSAN
jgi:Fur family transcriptional regulator, ferric uptake regulator